MKGRFNFGVAFICAVLGALLIVPAWGQVKEGAMERFKQGRIELIKKLKLAPDKEKAVLAVEEKYSGQRQEIVASLKKNQEELNSALAAPKPDEAKVKEVVGAITAGMDSLFNSFKSQREEATGAILL